MTDEQIRQDAIRYVGANYDKEQLDLLLNGKEQPHPVHEEPLIRAYIAGAHSRDEEIKELNGQVTLHKDRADYYHDLYMKHRNPWISIEDRLPEEHQDVLIENWNGSVIRNDYISIGDINYMKDNPELFPRWMPTPKPELKKGE